MKNTHRISWFLLVLLLPAVAFGGQKPRPAPLPSCQLQDTGVTLTSLANTALGNDRVVPDDGTLTTGAALTYQDNQDGTVTDLATGLMWAKKSWESDDGNDHPEYPHLVVTRYPWSTPRNAPGVTVWDWIAALNAAQFAGHTDWRLPNIRELLSLMSWQYGTGGWPDYLVERAFNTNCRPGSTIYTGSCTVGLESWGSVGSGVYWSSTLDTTNATNAWAVDFKQGGLASYPKEYGFQVRAVRLGCMGVTP